MKTSTINSYKLAYAQWGYKPPAYTAENSFKPLQPEHAATTYQLGRVNKDGSVTTLYFHPSHINLITSDKDGNVLNATHDLPYPMLADG